MLTLLGKEEAAEKQENPKLEKASLSLLYVFQNSLSHQIIETLKETSNEASSYSGVKISRTELENFVEFLRDAEYEERIHTTEETINKEDLRYSYAPDQGKGSHTKVKLGRGIKPIILSEQGRLLTTEQLQDLKAAIEQKGLL